MNGRNPSTYGMRSGDRKSDPDLERAVGSGVDQMLPAVEAREHRRAEAMRRRRNAWLLACLTAVLISAGTGAYLEWWLPRDAAERQRISAGYTAALVHSGRRPSKEVCEAAQQAEGAFRARGDKDEAFTWHNTARVDCRKVGIVLP